MVVSPRSFLVASCGTVLLIDLSTEPNVVDAVSGQAVKQDKGVAQVRCDTDGGTVARLGKATSLNGGPLALNGKIIGTTVADFCISPNGRFLAYSDENELCIYDKENNSKSCFDNFRQVGQMSLWDDGTVVAAAETSQGCPLTPQLTTVPGSSTWPCPALFRLQPGVERNLIQFLATHPQILPRSTGELLSSVK